MVNAFKSFYNWLGKLEDEHPALFALLCWGLIIINMYIICFI